jgi:formate hydrogenlyase subunit 6/NADH:ubiquinone oxidoreductase subunit I
MLNQKPGIGDAVVISKPELNNLFNILAELEYKLIGPQVKDYTIILGPIDCIADLPKGVTSQEKPGRYTLLPNGKENYFDVTSGPHSWKKYFFPPQSELMVLKQDPYPSPTWSIAEAGGDTPLLALIGVRSCDLAGIQIQDRVFLEGERCDPIYRDRREGSFILVANCTAPCDTCFCTSMGTGPKATGGFDLALTEVEDHFLMEIGSPTGEEVMGKLDWQAVSKTITKAAESALEAAEKKITLNLPHPERLESELLGNLDHPQWDDVASRCLSCGSCTQVCPTCFCWDAVDKTSLPGDTVIRERLWDSCFNPDYSYVAHGNTRPNTRARYRQWLSHKFASWYEQFGSSGCVGCGRCITWCPAEINHLEEIATIRQGEPS